MKTTIAIAFVVLAWGQKPPALGEDPSPLRLVNANTELLGRWDEWDGAYADVWGDGAFAYLCEYGHNCIHIIDVGDPRFPVEVSTVCADPPNDGASAQDVQVGDGLMFVALEADGHDGVLIVDVRDPLHPVPKTVVTIPGYQNVHNVFYHNKFLFLADSRTNRVGIVNLRAYDVDQAPERIENAQWILQDVGASFVHDITVRGNRLYACAWNSGIWVYGISDLARSRPSRLAIGPGVATHSCWPSDDGKFIVTGEERQGGGITVFEYRSAGDVGGGQLIARSSSAMNTRQAFCVHNQFMIGNRLYNAWYQSGLTVHDVDPATGALDSWGGYDTYPGKAFGYDGAWGVYPFSDAKVLVSDIDTGLYIMDVSGVPKILLERPLPRFIGNSSSTQVAVRILHRRSQPEKAAVNLHVAFGGETPITIPMSETTDSIFTAEIPEGPCGSIARIHFSTTLAGGAVITDPPRAPVSAYEIPVVQSYVELARWDFEDDASTWITGVPEDSAVTGAWMKGNPHGTRAQPENDATPGPAHSCFFTGQAQTTAPESENDLDGGITTLISPRFSLAGDNLWFGYHRWFFTGENQLTLADHFTVSVSDDDGAHWVLVESVTYSRGEWVAARWKLADFIQPSDRVLFRFQAADLAPDTLLEAAMDDFTIARLSCPSIAGDFNKDGRISLTDAREFSSCLGGPNLAYTPLCGKADMDGDHDADLLDVASFQRAFGYGTGD